MSANFWGSTHGQNWMLHEKTLRVSKKTDLKYISETDLIRLRCLFVHLITKLGRRLGVRQVVIATAWTYFKRFYSKNGFRLTDPTLVAATCVYLACKMEESPHHIKVITNEIRTLLSNDYGIQYPYDNQKLAEMEFYLLEELEFNMVVFHPYRTLMRVAREFGSRNEVIQRAWEIVNDSYKTDVCLQYPPHLIAYAALVIAAAAPDGGRTRSSRNNTTTAAKAADGPIKDLRKYLSEWHVDLSKVTRIVRELVRFYSNWGDYHENHKAIHAYRKLKHHAGDKTDDPTSVASDNRAELDRTDPDDLDDLELTGVEEVDRAIKEFSSKLGKQRKRNRGGIVNDLDVELGRWWEQSAYQHASTAATPSAPVQTATPNVTRKRP